jgi:hypothetical protein
MFCLSSHLIEKKTEKDQDRAEHLLPTDGIAEDQHRTENGEELPCRRKDRTGQRAEPFDGQKDEILQTNIRLLRPIKGDSLLLDQSHRLDQGEEYSGSREDRFEEIDRNHRFHL